MFRVVAHATLMVIAPSAPVAWSPGTPPLSESLRARIRAGAGAAAERAVSVLPESGRRVVTVPIEAATQRVIGIRSSGAGLGTSMRAPWVDPDPVPGVVIHTSLVPNAWLRPSTASRPVGGDAVSPEPARIPVHHPTGHREAVPVPTSTRIRRAAMMAFGLLVSLVAVEAAARVGRR